MSTSTIAKNFTLSSYNEVKPNGSNRFWVDTKRKNVLSEIKNFLQSNKKIPHVVLDTSDEEEYTLEWWDQGIYNSLSIWEDGKNCNFTSVKEGVFLKDVDFATVDDLRLRYASTF